MRLWNSTNARGRGCGDPGHPQKARRQGWEPPNTSGQHPWRGRQEKCALWWQRLLGRRGGPGKWWCHRAVQPRKCHVLVLPPLGEEACLVALETPTWGGRTGWTSSQRARDGCASPCLQPRSNLHRAAVPGRRPRRAGAQGEGRGPGACSPVSAARAPQPLQERPDLALHVQQLGLAPGVQGGASVIFQVPQQEFEMAPDPGPIPVVEVPLDFTEDH